MMTDSRAEHGTELLLWRHADAEDGFPDAGRALTKKGLKQATLVADWLKPRLPRECRILVSPAKRAQQTAAALELPYTTEAGVGVSKSASDILAAAGWPERARAVLVVGHQPTLGYLASGLLAGEQSDWTIKKGALWWFSGRGGEVYLRAVVSPDLL
jgi:phosphohistidine phosphatase